MTHKDTQWEEVVEQVNKTTGHAPDYTENMHEECMTCLIISDLKSLLTKE